MMRAALFVEPGRIALDDKPIPDVGANDALIRITTTTICGTDVHILKGENTVTMGLMIGHEPVGMTSGAPTSRTIRPEKDLAP
jgi:threonine dehydrogenase-like Zn-dependent dehydrogenase